METILLELPVEQCLLIKKSESAFKNDQWNAIEQKFKGKLGMNLKMDDRNGFGWNEESHMAIIDDSLWDDYVMLSIIVGNDFAKGVGVRMAAQLERDIDDDIEDVRETIVGLDDDDDTPVQSRTNEMIINPLEKSTSVMSSRKKKKNMVDTVERIGVAVKEIGAVIVELRKPAANPHIREVYRALH
ncbi:hypothetical protein AMTRI_Chr13g119360 [Amborella trichopoda]